MPRDESAPRFTVYDPVHYGEVPRTRFIDWLDAITVDLVNYPDRDRLYEALTGIQVAAWAEDVEDIERARDLFKADYIVRGQSLPLGLEVPTFTFRVSGVSRIMTHQIVRNRLGVVYSQKGTANQDVRHQDVLVPRALNRVGEVGMLEDYILLHLDFKRWYSQAMDSRRHSMMAVRYAMPHSMAQFIYVTINLASLQGLVGKRLCTCEAIEYNTIAGLMVERVRGVFPEFAPMLKAACDTKAGCYYQRAFGTPIGYTLHFPDEKHDVGPWNPENYLHQATRDELVGGPQFKTREYLGYRWVR
jgi:thymidylate synthase (FAD)